MIGIAAAAVFGVGLVRASGLRGALAVVAAAALGLGAESAVYATSLLAAGPRATAWSEMGLAIAGIALLALRRRPFEAPPVASDPAPRSLQVLFAGGCAVCAAALAAQTWRFPEGGWDAWMIWNLRARFLYRGAEGFRAAFSPAMVYLVHQDYPFLVPGIVAQGFGWIGRETAGVPIAVAALYGCMLVSAVVAAGRSLAGSRWALMAGLAIVALPCFPTFAADQQSDVPLALYLLLASALIDLRQPLLAGFAAGLAAWTKNEGALYAGLFTLALFWRSRDRRAPFFFVAGASPLLFLFAAYKLFVVPPTDLAALSTRASVLRNAIDVSRWLELAWLLIRRLFYVQRFGLWLVAEVLALLLLLPKHRPGPVGTALLLACAALSAIYLLQPFSLQWIVRTSVDRLIVQLWPAAVLATATALAQARTTART